jgi:3',5'-cyclic AMP phosphodiesterase CpdA
MTAILQITDTHIVPEGTLVSGRLDTAGPLRRLVQRITDICHQIGPVDAVLVSGDVSNDGSAQSYLHFKEILTPLDLPIYVIPGNHDAREPMRKAFCDGGYLSANGKLNWHQQIGDIHLIGLDTLIEGENVGMLDAPTLAYLDDVLASIGHGPVLLTLHHPPFNTGIRFIDDIGLRNNEDLLETLSGFEGELRIVCGHIHCMMTVSFGGHISISAPSPSSCFALDMRPNAPVGFIDMEDGCLLHKWDDGFQTVRIGPERGAGPFPF